METQGTEQKPDHKAAPSPGGKPGGSRIGVILLIITIAIAVVLYFYYFMFRSSLGLGK